MPSSPAAWTRELRQQSGDAAVRELVARRQPLFHFAIRTTLAEFDLETAEGRTRALESTIPLVARIRDHALRANTHANSPVG